MIDVSRKEIKYILPIEKIRRLQTKLDAVMERDAYGENGEYMVRSQYFDTIWDRDLHDNLQGAMEKRKIRVRIYDVDAETAKLEYKCKSGNSGRKLSVTVTRQEALWMENGNLTWMLERSGDLLPLLYVKMSKGAYVPKTIVEYQRLAYNCLASDTRITFDMQMKGTVFPYGLFEKEPQYIPLLAEDLGLMEIKYALFLPDYVRGILRGADRMAEGNSKYTRARMLL